MVTLKIVLDTRYHRQDNLYNACLRVTYQRKQRYHCLNILLSKADFAKLSSKRVPAKLQEIRNLLKERQTVGEDILKSLHPFSFEAFKGELKKRLAGLNNVASSGNENATGCSLTTTLAYLETFAQGIEEAPSVPVSPETSYKNDPQLSVVLTDTGEAVLVDVIPERKGEVYHLYEIMIAAFNKQERVGTANSHQCSINSLLRFRPKLEFTDITPEFLFAYENWMLSRGLSLTTVGIYLRALRDVFNEAIERKMVSADSYPFGLRRYPIPTGVNIKCAFSDAEVKTLYNYEPANSYEALALDFWFFIYFANGLNIQDVALLRFGNIHGDFIIIPRRTKVRRTSRSNILPITIFINERMKDIMCRRGNRSKDPDNYIFPILQQGLSARRQKELTHLFLKRVNTFMGRIAVKLGFDRKPKTKDARHTFSTKMKNEGASIEMIQEALGHADPTTTQNYLDSFITEKKRELALKLIPKD